MRRFLTQLLDEYGLPLERFAGIGTVESEGETTPVDWASAQYGDGQVLLACAGKSIQFDVFSSAPHSFNGQNSDGVMFHSDRLMVDLPILKDLPSDRTGWWAVYRLGMLEADFAPGTSSMFIRYLLTNFEADVGCKGKACPLVLPGVDGSIRLVPVERASSVIDQLRALRIAKPTTWLEMPLQPAGNSGTRQIADDVCYLLSIARGTKVSWIAEEEVGREGTRTRLVCANRITKPFAPHAPIDPRLVGGTSDFLEACYPTFVEKRDHYKLDRGTIDSVLDAKGETDFLETRGAKLAVALETLKNNVLAAGDSNKEYLASPHVFDQCVDRIAGPLVEALVDGGVGRRMAKAIVARPRLRGLNRRSFSDLLGGICKQIDLRLDAGDLKLFTYCRNSLVHRGGFYCSTALEEEHARVTPKPTKFAEYLFMISVVDAFLLRLVGYRGPYLVHAEGSKFEIRDL